MIAVGTIAEILRIAARSLLPHSESPRLDAELLLAKVMGLSRSTLIVRAEEAVPTDMKRSYDRLLARRVAGTPVAYLTGSREFWSLTLTVTADVLVPRPETETLVELTLTLVPKGQECSILDLGTGCGAIALALASERPDCRITAVEVSAGALKVAAANSRLLGLPGIDWRLGSWYEAVPGARFDVIVANPPYVAADDPALGALAAEPMLALNGGPAGLDALESIAAGAAMHLNTPGWLVLEHGAGQSVEVANMLKRHGFTGIRPYLDAAGKPRVTLGTVQSQH